MDTMVPTAGTARVVSLSSLRRERLCRRCYKVMDPPPQKNSIYHIGCMPKSSTERNLLNYRFQKFLQGEHPIRMKTSVVEVVEVMKVGDYAEIKTCAECGEEFVARDPRAKICSLWCFGINHRFTR